MYKQRKLSNCIFHLSRQLLFIDEYIYSFIQVAQETETQIKQNRFESL